MTNAKLQLKSGKEFSIVLRRKTFESNDQQNERQTTNRSFVYFIISLFESVHTQKRVLFQIYEAIQFDRTNSSCRKRSQNK